MNRWGPKRGRKGSVCVWCVAHGFVEQCGGANVAKRAAAHCRRICVVSFFVNSSWHGSREGLVTVVQQNSRLKRRHNDSQTTLHRIGWRYESRNRQRLFNKSPSSDTSQPIQRSTNDANICIKQFFCCCWWFKNNMSNIAAALRQFAALIFCAVKLFEQRNRYIEKMI